MDTVEAYKRIDMRVLKSRWHLKENRKSYWNYGRTFRGEPSGDIGYWVDTQEMYVNPVFTQTNRDEEKQKFDYKIRMAKTDCTYGWYRYWFVCPNCSKRRVVLCLSNDWHFYCRKCLHLCYSTQATSRFSRRWDCILPSIDEEEKAEKLLKTIKYKIRNGRYTRKWKRYLKLTREVLPASERMRRLDILLGSLGDSSLTL